MISEALPRTIAGLNCNSSAATAPRHGRPPAAIGSRTQGLPAFWAAAAARRIDSTCAAVGVPRLISTASAMPANSAGLLGIVDHRRRRAGGEQHVGDEIGRDGVGQRLDERRRFARSAAWAATTSSRVGA